MYKKNILKCICISGFIIISGIFYSCNQQGEGLVLETDGASATSPVNSGDEETEVRLQSESQIYVYVCGYVAAPGVYEFEPGLRVIDAIDAAGGFITGAADTYLNLADILADGSKIYVPSLEEVSQGLVEEELSPTQESALVNINTASLEQLKTLPGIGEAKAKDIINYRESQGQFSSIEDLKNVPGIKDGVFNKVKELISVN